MQPFFCLLKKQQTQVFIDDFKIAILIYIQVDLCKNLSLAFVTTS